MKKGAKIFLALLMTIMLLALPSEAVLAQEEGELKGIFGRVTAVNVGEDGTGTLTLETKQGKKFEIELTADTVIRVPPRGWVSAAEIQEGDRVAVLALKTAERLVAKRVMVIPRRPVHLHIKGVVTEIEGNKVILDVGNGKEVTLELPQAEGLEVGDRVLFVVVKPLGVAKVKVKALKRALEIRQRLNRMLKALEEQAPVAPKEKARLEELRLRLRKLLLRNQEREQEVLKRVMKRAPKEALPALRRALERSRLGLERARREIEEKGMIGPGVEKGPRSKEHIRGALPRRMKPPVIPQPTPVPAPSLTPVPEATKSSPAKMSPPGGKR